MALKEGNELLAGLRETAMGGQCDVRPDSIKVEVKKSIAQVELWLEELHDRRNDLEQAWQTRKMQLEQCLAFAILIRDINELQQQLRKKRDIFDNQKRHLDLESNMGAVLYEIDELKQDAISIRDRALKITRSTEKLSHNSRIGGLNGSNKAYTFLNECTEFLEEIDMREDLLIKTKEFFTKANKILSTLRKLEIETTNMGKESLSDKCSIARLINDVGALVEEPLRLGYSLLDRIGRSNADAAGIEKTVVDIENRRIYLEEFYTQNSIEYVKIAEALNEFYETCINISSWLMSIGDCFLKTNNSMGCTLDDGKSFLKLHHQLLSDLEIKGTEINTLLVSTSKILNSLEDHEREQVDKRIQSLHETWNRLKTIVENRVDLSTNFIKLLQITEKLIEMFKYVEQILQTTPDEVKLSQMDELWLKIKTAYAQLKDDGNSFVDHISMVRRKNKFHILPK